MPDSESIDRLAMRGRPEGEPILHQRWESMLLLHWPIIPDILRPLIPPALELDTYEGRAWIGITPFHLEDVRPSALPAFPGLSSFHELNVRTYVMHNGLPGIWFLTLDASKLIPMVAARVFFMLPYYKASIRFLQTGETFAFNLRRTVPVPAEFRVAWRRGLRLRDPALESLGFFLTERYCAFAVNNTELYSIRTYHHPWILDEAEVELRHSSMISSLGIPEPTTAPLAHFSASMEMETWAPVSLGSAVKSSVRAP